MIEFNVAQWSPAELRQYQQRGYRARRAGEFPPVSAIVRPDDYDNELKRGTIEYNEGWRNYAFHVVNIPGGSVVRACNFAQGWPGTAAIVTDGPIELIECNLVNCQIDPSWKLTNCNTVQAWRVAEKDEAGADRERFAFICSHPVELKGDEQPPKNAVLSQPL